MENDEEDWGFSETLWSSTASHSGLGSIAGDDKKGVGDDEERAEAMPNKMVVLWVQG